MTIRVLIADDHAVMRDGLTALLAANPEIEVVGAVANGREALRLAVESKPHVVIMDIAMPELNGIEATGLLCERCPEARVVMLSMHSDAEHVYRALDAGAAGYLLKDSAGEEVVSAVRAVQLGRQYLSSALAGLERRAAPRASPLASLSSRERQVLQAYYRAGYDHVNVRPPGFEFLTGRDFSGRTVSLSGGGLIVDWPTYEAYQWPDPDAADYGVFDALAAVLPDGMKLIAYGPGGVLENVIQIVGFEQLCFLLADDPDMIECVFEAVGETLVRYYEIVAAHPAVGACIDNDDWGFKTGTMLSPRQMREYVFPWHKRIVAAIHAAGKPVILHSCGHFERILARHTFGGDSDPYLVLGIPADLPFDEVRRAYRKLVAENHPDRLIAKGVPPEFIAVANEKLAAINDAWDNIEKDPERVH